MINRTLIAFTAAVTLGCVPVATNALAVTADHGGHPGAAHATAGHAHAGHVAAGYASGRRHGPVYNRYEGGGGGYGCRYSYGCPGYGVVPGVVDGILGGFGPF